MKAYGSLHNNSLAGAAASEEPRKVEQAQTCMFLRCETGFYQIEIVSLSELNSALAAMRVTSLSEADIMAPTALTHYLLKL